MGLESGSFISALVSTNPVGATDPKSQGDDHIRFIKAKLLETFPNVTGAVTASHTELNLLTGSTSGLATLSVSFAAVVASLSAITTLVSQMGTLSSSVTSSDITGSIRKPVLQTTGVSAGTYTAATVVVDTKGRITAATAGTIPVQDIKAWVNFNGTGTVAIRASSNVTSITDNNTGNYTINFTSALADANFCVTGAAKLTDNNTAASNNLSVAPYSFTTTAVSIMIIDGGGAARDPAITGVAIFR